MTFRQAVLTGVVAGLIAACGSTGAGSPALVATPRQTTPPVAVSPSPTPPPVPTATQALVPPKPTDVTFDTQALLTDETQQYAKVTQTVTWRTPRSDVVEIKVYGVTKCIAEPKNPRPESSGPCLLTGTPLPASVRTLLGTAHASDGALSWSWTVETGCDFGLANEPDKAPYYSVVLAAYNAAGHSIFAIAEPGRWWGPTPDDIVC